MPNMNPNKCPMPEQAPDVRNKNFEEVTLGYTAEMAIEEAQRCLNCKNKPCMTGCPVQVKIPEFISLVAEGKFLEAAAKMSGQMSCRARRQRVSCLRRFMVQYSFYCGNYCSSIFQKMES